MRLEVPLPVGLAIAVGLTLAWFPSGQPCVGPAVERPYDSIHHDVEAFSLGNALQSEGIWLMQSASKPEQRTLPWLFSMWGAMLDGWHAGIGVPTRLRADIDGDGLEDRVSIVVDDGRMYTGVLVEFASGSAHLLGARRPTLVRYGGPFVGKEDEDGDDPPPSEWHKMDECSSSYEWVQSVQVVERANDGILHWRDSTFEHELAVGDGLFFDGGSSYAMYFFDGKDWRWSHAGF
ncbi:MAG: hypothetical protein AAGA54_25930 [Myxococcota bacterium]